MKNNRIKQLIFWVGILLKIVLSDTFHFNRILECIHEESEHCVQWNNTIIAYHVVSFFHSCFPADTYVLTEEGPRMMKELKVHDRIFAYDKQTGKSNFSEIVAWLHRDTQGYLQYQQIHTIQNYTFSSSETHNIGFLKKGWLDFKFAKQLLPGDQLMGFGKNLTVSKDDKTKQEKGLFSPMTSMANFYIFPNNINSQDFKQSPMLLVHSLPQVQNPLSHERWVFYTLHFLGWLGINEHQNEIHEIYAHPISQPLHLLAAKSKSRSHQYRIENHERGGRGGGGSDNGERRRKQKQVAMVCQFMINEIILKSP